MSTYAVWESFIWLFKSKWAFPSLNQNAQVTFLVVQWLRLGAPHAGGPGVIPGQGTRSHIPQLKIPRAATKAWCSQIKRKKCIPKTSSTYLHRSGEVLCSQEQGRQSSETASAVPLGSLLKWQPPHCCQGWWWQVWYLQPCQAAGHTSEKK